MNAGPDPRDDAIDVDLPVTDEVDAIISACWQAGDDIEKGRPAKKMAERLARKLLSFVGATNGAGTVSLIDDASIERQPPIEYLIDGHIPLGAACEMHGPPGSAKTFIALHYSLCAAAGISCLERTVRRAPVLYIAAEGRAGIGARVSAWKDAHGLSGRLGVDFHTEPLALHDPAAVGRFLELTRRLPEQPGLVVIDTLARCMPGADENSARDVGLAISGIDRIRHATGGAVLVIHHTNAGGEKERGSTALRGAMDVMIGVKREEGGPVSISCEKMKDAPPFETITAQLCRRLNSMVLITAKTGFAVIAENLTGKPREALLSLQRFFEGGSASSSAWMKACGWPDRTFHLAVNPLRDGGYVSFSKEGRSRIYTVTPKGHTAIAAKLQIPAKHPQCSDPGYMHASGGSLKETPALQQSGCSNGTEGTTDGEGDMLDLIMSRRPGWNQ